MNSRVLIDQLTESKIVVSAFVPWPSLPIVHSIRLMAAFNDGVQGRADVTRPEIYLVHKDDYESHPRLVEYYFAFKTLEDAQSFVHQAETRFGHVEHVRFELGP